MSSNVGIIDYGASNIRAVCNALDFVGCDSYAIVRSPHDLADVDRLVLPGVGAAGSALARLREKGLDEAICEFARRRGRPLLGICLGMQLLAEQCLENGQHRGLGLVRGSVRHLSTLTATIRVPHIGWATVSASGDLGNRIFVGATPMQFYFAHSYFLDGHEPGVDIGRTLLAGNVSFTSAIASDTVIATQFHPERSQINGVRLLEWFVSWTP
jgi:glutamine amidotransferase